MQKLLSIFKNDVWAAFMFFTRLPLWRWHQPEKYAFSRVVNFWPLTGWLTAAVMAGVLYGGSQILPYSTAIILAIASRLLLTGALHEDGLADFFDGMGGGGSDRNRILTIMKDSHIGTFGVLSLIIYMLLLYTSLHTLAPATAALAILAFDPYSKMLSAQIIQMLPYARTEQTAKNRTVYAKPSWQSGISLAVQGLLPISLFVYHMGRGFNPTYILFLPALTMYLLYLLIRHHLGGYTGDCCGAMCLLVELTAYISLQIIVT